MNAKNLFMAGVEPLLMSTLGKIMKKIVKLCFRSNDELHVV